MPVPVPNPYLQEYSGNKCTSKFYKRWKKGDFFFSSRDLEWPSIPNCNRLVRPKVDKNWTVDVEQKQ